MSLLCPVRSGPHHAPHCLACHPSCDELERARQAVQRCPTCRQVLSYDQIPPVAVKSSLRAPHRLVRGGVQTAAQNYNVAPYVFDDRYNDPQLADTRHVHFDLPDHKTKKRGLSLYNDGNDETIVYVPKSARQTRRRNTSSSDKTAYPHLPANQPERRAPLNLDGKPPTPVANHHLPRAPAISYPRPPPAPPPPPPPPNFHPSLPTIYILTYSTTSLATSNLPFSLLSTQLPSRTPPIPHLYTIDARPFTPPPPAICAKYSGIAPLVQDMVLQDARAATAVRRAVRDLLDFRRCCEAGRVLGREVAMSVCCVFGTHRSVAVAERIAQGVRGWGKDGGGGVRVVCRHVSRVKGVGDPF